MGRRQGEKAAPRLSGVHQGRPTFLPFLPEKCLPVMPILFLQGKEKGSEDISVSGHGVVRTEGRSLSPHTLPGLCGQWVCLQLGLAEAKPFLPLWGARLPPSAWL